LIFKGLLFKLLGLCNQTYSFFNSLTTSCEIKKNESETCSQTIPCLGDMICTSGTCRCSNTSTHFFEFSNLTCIQKTSINTFCSASRTCRNDLGLSCQNNLCQCSSPKFWLLGNCSDPLGYNNTGCSINSHCNVNQGLFCSSGYCKILSYHDSIKTIINFELQGLCN
jgi:hypothetical protein